MSTLSIIYAALFYFATATLLLGMAVKIKSYIFTPSPLKIPVMPAPMTKVGVGLRMIREVAFFESLFKSNRWIWILAILFHAGLLLALARHLRYFIEPAWGWVVFVQPFGIYGGMAMVAGLLGLWARRFLVERVRYISGPSDHLMLALLVLIGASGLSLRFLIRTDIIQVKAFFLGLLRFDIQALPAEGPLLIHLAAVAALMIVFPFSKLLHVPGVFFSPARTQVDDAREKRHLAAWAAPMDGERDA